MYRIIQQLIKVRSKNMVYQFHEKRMVAKYVNRETRTPGTAPRWKQYFRETQFLLMMSGA